MMLKMDTRNKISKTLTLTQQNEIEMHFRKNVRETIITRILIIHKIQYHNTIM